MAIETLQAAGLAHSEMVNAILQRVQTGELAPGDRLPSEIQLSQQFRISVTSVRKGVRALAARGLITRRRGSGTFLTAKGARPASAPPVYRGAALPTDRQSVAIILPLALASYHPFFSEQMAGIRRGLADLGWGVWDFDYEHLHLTKRDVANVAVRVPELVARLQAERHLAGAIVGATLAAELVEAMPTLPLVAANAWPGLSYVDYDWPSEQWRALHQLAKLGSGRVWTTGRRAPEATVPGVELVHSPLPHSHLQSEITSNAFAAFQAAWTAGPPIDGVLARDEFEAQGVADAALKLGLRVPDDFQMVAMVSRKSQLRSPFPICRLLADGELKGRELASLLHERLTRPASAPREVVLAGTFNIY